MVKLDDPMILLNDSRGFRKKYVAGCNSHQTGPNPMGRSQLPEGRPSAAQLRTFPEVNRLQNCRVLDLCSDAIVIAPFVEQLLISGL